ncbi:MAG TPA: hypothetical protein P5277_03795 [Candidatus Paceibacterota bacterium]|nr:hypothetical protein [Candidatus Paceibacterota bacterium]
MGEKILSIWMFFIWFFIAAVIGASLLIFASGNTDVREFQASIMKNRILDCLNQNLAISTDFSFDIYNECRFNKDIIEKNLYFKVTIKNFDTGEVVKVITGGNKDFATYCDLKYINQIENQKIEADNFPKCFFSESLSYDSDFGRYKIEVITASNNIGGRI